MKRDMFLIFAKIYIACSPCKPKLYYIKVKDSFLSGSGVEITGTYKYDACIEYQRMIWK